MTTFRIVGAGRVGLALSDALTKQGWQQLGILTHEDFRRRTASFVNAAANVDVLFLAVPDDVIDEVATTIAPDSAVLLHLSGAKTLDALKPHQRIGSIHPLLSVPNPTVGSERLLAKATFAIAGDAMAAEVVEALGGTPIAIGETERALYHATASIAANHLVALCAQVERLASEVGAPTEAYWALMASTLENVVSQGPSAALTGPAARGDIETIRTHIGALADSEHQLYLVLSDEAARLSGQTPPSAVLDDQTLDEEPTIEDDPPASA